MTFQEALDLLGKRERKKVGNNTYLRKISNNEIHLELHGSSILRFFPGSVIYDSCGWKTLTTKNRMNDFGKPGISIYSEHKKWFIYNNLTKSRMLFEDGIIFEE